MSTVSIGMGKRTRMECATRCGGDALASATPDPPAASAPPGLCRYKTGRCTNPRVVKPNGALLLLCEFHRCQQNRTKKRSDMKYRQYRAEKRQLERAKKHPHARDSLWESLLASTDLSTAPSPRLHSPSSKRAKSTVSATASAPDSAAPLPPVVICSSSALEAELPLSPLESKTPAAVASGSPTTTADFERAVSQCSSTWADALLTPTTAPVSPTAWEPEELELLEYFIMS